MPAVDRAYYIISLLFFKSAHLHIRAFLSGGWPGFVSLFGGFSRFIYLACEILFVNFFELFSSAF